MNKLVLVLAMATVAAGGLIACGGGGSNSNLCTVPADCTDTALPYCVAGVCHACESPTNCNAAAPVCEAEVFECGGCVNDASCGAYPATSHCAPSGACVGCVTSEQCSGMTPVCDTGPGTCRACSLDSECASGACNLESGACIAEASILYAAPTGTPNTMCTRAMPCTVKQALNIVNTAKSTVVLADGDYNFNSGTSALLSGAKSALVIGTVNAKLNANSPAPAILVSNSAILSLRGITLKSSNYFAVDCQKGFLQLSKVSGQGGQLSPLLNLQECVTSVEQCRFDGYALLETYLVDPTGRSKLSVTASRFTVPAIATTSNMLSARDGSATISNSLFVNYSTSCNPCTAVELSDYISGSNTKVFDFNTVVNATIESDTANGVVFAVGNIFSAPTQSLTVFGGGYFSNLFNLQASPSVSGTGNITGDPKFVNPAAGDFHLMPDSPAIDKGPTGVPTGLPNQDLDGNARLVGAATDMGAFEFHP